MIGDIIGCNRLDPVAFADFDQVRARIVEDGGDVDCSLASNENRCPVCSGRIITYDLTSPLMLKGDSIEYDQCVRCFRFYPLEFVWDDGAAGGAGATKSQAAADCGQVVVSTVLVREWLISRLNSQSLNTVMCVLVLVEAASNETVEKALCALDGKL